MRIVFVIGPGMSGKSFYIARVFPDAAVVTIHTFDQHVSEAESNEEINQIAMNAQYYCREELQNRIRAMKSEDVLVLEHPMMQKQARAFYIDAVRAVTDTPIECVVVTPSGEMLSNLLRNEEQLRIFYEYEKGKFEHPDLDEGFTEIRYVRPFPEERMRELSES